LRQLAVGGSIAERGIIAEKLAGGEIRWSINIMVDGERIHRVVGLESAGVTRTQAEEFIAAARTKAREGRLNLPQGRKLPLLFSDAAVKYEEAGGRNIKIKKRQIRMYLNPFFGSTRLDAISEEKVDEYRNQRKEAGASVATINRELATLKHLLGWAVKRKHVAQIEHKPVLEKEGEGRIIALSDEQCSALLKAAVSSSNTYVWLFVMFGLNTAMRHSEILAARFDQLDLDGRRLFVPDAKAGQREQPITPELAAALKREREMREDRAGWTFPSPHKDSEGGHIARMDKPFREAVKAAGLSPAVITPHVMRHTAITALVKAGVDLPTIQKISGHKTLAMVLRYSHVKGRHIDEAIQKIGRGVGEGESPSPPPAAAEPAPPSAKPALRVVK
jgi:integrase